MFPGLGALPEVVQNDRVELQLQINALVFQLLQSGLSLGQIDFWLRQDLQPHLILRRKQETTISKGDRTLANKALPALQPSQHDGQWDEAAVRGNKCYSSRAKQNHLQPSKVEPEVKQPLILQSQLPGPPRPQALQPPLSQVPSSRVMALQKPALQTATPVKSKTKAPRSMPERGPKASKSVRFLYCVPLLGETVVMQKSRQPPYQLKAPQPKRARLLEKPS